MAFDTTNNIILQPTRIQTSANNHLPPKTIKNLIKQYRFHHTHILQVIVGVVDSHHNQQLVVGNLVKHQVVDIVGIVVEEQVVDIVVGNHLVDNRIVVEVVVGNHHSHLVDIVVVEEVVGNHHSHLVDNLEEVVGIVVDNVVEDVEDNGCNRLFVGNHLVDIVGVHGYDDLYEVGVEEQSVHP
eukprot:TRINITY_DN66_c0_g1_i2.p1 TRINITY_DN66_c0_g1~~TRINITY_DN66_c0_g1_i2.p1  ORF type:complete len:183 (+),score=37.43 TRINITY_DN66_c0_g1_i2:162-710(+)